MTFPWLTETENRNKTTVSSDENVTRRMPEGCVLEVVLFYSFTKTEVFLFITKYFWYQTHTI
jgi:hypothetical protein